MRQCYCYSRLYLLHMHYVARDQETFTWTLCRRLCKAAIRGNPTLQCARWTLCVCSQCTMTSIPGKDSHAEEEACARDTNNIKEINTSRYPQFIKLYTVCFSFSFGPRNQKENEKMIYVSSYRRRQESKQERETF